MAKEFRYWKATPLKNLVERATKPAQKKRGFSEQRILTDWSQIVGDTIAAKSQPLKINFDRSGRHGGTLHLQVDPAWAMEIQYMEAMIIEKVAVFFGYKAVEKLTIIQTPINRTSKKQASSANTSEATLSPQMQDLVDNIEDEELRQAFEKFSLTREIESSS